MTTIYNLKIKPFTENDHKLVNQYYKNHKSFYKGDSGLDLFFLEDVTIKAGETKKIPFGIACEMVNNGDNFSYVLMPRSSIVKTPLRMCNSIGMIDAGYRGQLMAYVDNIKDKDYTVKAGTRLFQIIAPNFNMIRCELVNKLSETSRGTGGFGSSNSSYHNSSEPNNYSAYN